MKSSTLNLKLIGLYTFPDNINLDTLLFQLRGKNLEWYKLGEAMGIQKEMLDKFSKQCSPEECLIETLEYWLQNHIGQPTWREIAKYLKMVELNDLAEEIENVYTTGTTQHHTSTLL